MVRTLSAVLFTSILIISLTGCGAGDIQLTTNSNGAKLLSLSIAPTEPAIAMNTGQQLTATGIYSDNTTRDVTSSVIWSSSDTTVASVDNDATISPANAIQPSSLTKPGRAYAKAVGKAKITASAGDLSASTTLTVTPAVLVSISITPTNPSIAKGTKQQFSATGTFSDNTTQDLTATASWTSSSTAISTISNSGLATALATGTATITATSGSVSGSTTLTVTPAVLLSLAITPVNKSIAKGTTQQFMATGSFSDNTTQDLTATSTWTSTSTAIATISNSGLAAALATGTTTITASAGGLSGSTNLTVSPATLGSISITPVNTSIAKGTKQQFIATGMYTDGTTQNLTSVAVWSSSNSTVATISNAAGSYGLATALATGPTTITAASGSISGSTTMTVTAAVLVSITVTPASPSIAKGTKQQFIATGTYSDNSTQVVTTAVTWSSSNTSVATVSNAAGSKGLASSANTGTATITATSGSISASATLTVTPAVLVSLAVTPAGPNIAMNATQQFVATGTYSDGSTQTLTAAVTWSSSSTTVAQISNAAGSNGLATGIAAGTATITAISGSISKSVTLSVTSAAASGTLSWAVPTQFSDGTPMSSADINGYRVYVSTASGAYNSQTFVFVPSPSTSVNISTFNLTPGQYYFVVTVVDTTGMESDLSNEVAVTIN